MDCDPMEIIEIDDDEDEKSEQDRNRSDVDIVDVDDSSRDTVFSMTCEPEPETSQDVVFQVIELDDDDDDRETAIIANPEVSTNSEEQITDNEIGPSQLDSSTQSVNSGNFMKNMYLSAISFNFIVFVISS